MRKLLRERFVRDELMAPQFFYYGLFILIVLLFVRRIMKNRSVLHYSPAQLAAKLKQSSGIILLDVRTKSERSAQHIQGSIHIPLHELAGRLSELKKFAGREIVCYCQTGNRSVSATALLLKNGFNAINLRGGMAEWNFSQLQQ